MTDAHGTDRLSFSSGELEYQRALEHGSWLEDGEWSTLKSLGPVGDGSTRRGKRDSDSSQSVIEKLG